MSCGIRSPRDYKTQTFEDVVHNYDAVFDTVGGETYTRSFRVLRKDGIIVSVLEQQNLELMKQFGVKAISQFTQVNKERLAKLAEWVDQNKVNIHIEKIFSGHVQQQSQLIQTVRK